MYYLYSVLYSATTAFVPLLPMLALYHLALCRRDRRLGETTPKRHIALTYLFCFALMSVMSVTGIPNVFHASYDPTVHLVPFSDASTPLHQHVLNAILFMPIGFLLPMLWKRFHRAALTFAWGALFSLSIELLQLFGARVTDIDDLLMNAAGTLVGYLLFRLVNRVRPNIARITLDRVDHWRWEPYVCIGLSWLSMLFLQPLVFALLIKLGVFGGVRFI